MPRELEALGDHMAPAPPATSWARLDVDAVLAGQQTDPEPTMLARTDGLALVYAGKVHAFQGESESGKTWVALALCAERLEHGERVLFLDFEDGPQSIIGRMLALGTAPESIREHFHYVRPDEPLNDQGRRDLDVAADGVTLAVIDGVTEALTLHGLDLASNVDVAKWLELLPRRLSRKGTAVVTLDHVVKDKDARGRYAIGAQHKLAGVDCAYGVAVIRAFGRGRDGRLKIIVQKDRPGHVRGFAHEGKAAEVSLHSRNDGTVTVTVGPPEGAAGGTFLPTTLMERVSRAVEAEPGLTKRAIRSTVKGRNNVKDLALELLITEGFVSEQQDGAQAVRHHSIRPFRQDAESTEQAPCPTVPTPCPRPQGHGSDDRAHRAPPLQGTGRGRPAQDAGTVPTTNGHGQWTDDELQALIDEHNPSERSEP
jgi:AAA domain